MWFATDPNLTVSHNYKDKVEKARRMLGCWKFRRLSLFGKIMVLKSLVVSQLVYILGPLQTDYEAIKELNTIFYKFLWNEKGDKIKRNVMINNLPEGGLKMIDVSSFNKSLKAYWIKGYFNTNNGSSWKSIFDFEFQPYGGKAVLLGNLNKKDIQDLIKTSDPFVKEILEIWSDIFERKLTSGKHLVSASLWYHSLIKIGNRPVFYKDWFLKGITKVADLMDACRYPL